MCRCCVIIILVSSTFYLILLYDLILLRSHANFWPFIILISIWYHSSSWREGKKWKYVNVCFILFLLQANITIIFPIFSQHLSMRMSTKKWDISNIFCEHLMFLHQWKLALVMVKGRKQYFLDFLSLFIYF